jgi:hypothetical protein
MILAMVDSPEQHIISSPWHIKSVFVLAEVAANKKIHEQVISNIKFYLFGSQQ